MKRRTVLIAGGGSLALVGVGIWGLRPWQAWPAPAAAQLEELARSLRGSAAVGRFVLEQQPDLEPELLLLERLGLQSSDEVLQDVVIESLQEAVISDFKLGRTIQSDGGWLLSETEAWLAALHTELMGDQASAENGVGFEYSRESGFIRIEDYGPDEMYQGEPLQHPDLAENVIWFTSPAPPDHLRVFIDDQRLLPAVNPHGFSINLPRQLLESLWSQPGEHEIWAYDPAAQLRQRIGRLSVVERDDHDEAVFCAVSGWGARETRAGQTFNEQPDGSSAFWIEIACAPEDTVVRLAGQDLPTTVQASEGLITARLVDHELYSEPGELEVELFSASKGESLQLGRFRVHQ